MRVPLNVLALVQTKLNLLVDAGGDNVTLMTSEKHMHMDSTSAAAIEISKKRAPMDSSSYFNLFHGFLCVPVCFPIALSPYTAVGQTTALVPPSAFTNLQSESVTSVNCSKNISIQKGNMTHFRWS